MIMQEIKKLKKNQKQQITKLIRNFQDIQGDSHQNSHKYKMAALILCPLSKKQSNLGYAALIKITNIIRNITLNLSISEEPRMDSYKNEAPIIEIIANIVQNKKLDTKKYTVTLCSGPGKYWYDFVLIFTNNFTKLVEFAYPINIKTSGETCADNAGSKEAIFFSCTGKDPKYLANNYLSTFIDRFFLEIKNKNNSEHFSDYGYLILTKKDYSQTKCTSLRRIESNQLTANGNNMFFQVNWKFILYEIDNWTINNTFELINKLIPVMHTSCDKRKEGPLLFDKHMSSFSQSPTAQLEFNF